jgi:hypothetical protein
MRHPRDEGRLVRGRPGTVCFGGLPGHLKEVELWLPQATPCELVALRADAPVDPPAPTGRRRWIHHGSSISHGAEADSPTGTWPVVAATRAGVEVVNLGFAGNAMLDPYVARTIRDFDADLISIKTGVNIVGGAGFTRRTFGPAVDGFLDTVRDGHPDAPLLVVSPIILPVAEAVHERPPDDGAGDGTAGITMTRLRTTLAAIVRRRARWDHHLYFLDGRELLGKDDLAHLADGTHPDAAGHRLIGERFAAQVFGADGPFQ